MTTISQQLAEALRVVAAGNTDYEDLQKIAREALAAYDAQQAAAPAAGRFVVYQDASAAKTGHAILCDGRTVAQFVNTEDAARIVQCVNAHDGLVSALRTIVNDKGSAAFNDDLEAYDAAVEVARNALAAYDAQQAKAPKFQLGDRVTKTKGSKWTGRVVGTYSTKLTPEGYAVESETEKGSVQIYPAAALEHAPSATAAPAASGGEVWTREMVADVHQRGEELYRRIHGANPPPAASVSERARELLAEVHNIEKSDIERHEATGDVAIRFALRAIEQALTQQRGEWTPLDIQTFARAYKAEVPGAELTAHGIDAGLHALTRPTTPQPGEAPRLRYFADGPQGSFFTNDLQLARDLVNLYDKDDDWTITDLENPYVPSDNGS